MFFSSLVPAALLPGTRASAIHGFPGTRAAASGPSDGSPVARRPPYGTSDNVVYLCRSLRDRHRAAQLRTLCLMGTGFGLLWLLHQFVPVPPSYVPFEVGIIVCWLAAMLYSQAMHSRAFVLRMEHDVKRNVYVARNHGRFPPGAHGEFSLNDVTVSRDVLRSEAYVKETEEAMLVKTAEGHQFVLIDSFFKSDATLRRFQARITS